MTTGEHPDVTSTLTDLERKLVDLERELNSVAGGSVVAAASAPALPEPPSGGRDTSLRVEDLRGEIADLARFRDQLESAARELVSEYDRLVARLQTGNPVATPPGMAGPFTSQPQPPSASAVPPAPPVAAPAAPQPLPAIVAAGMPAGAPEPPSQSTPPDGAQDETSFVGAVVIDAGPFTEITALQTFEQALTRVDGAEDVYVRSFEGDRALVDVRLSNPVPLVHLLRNVLPWPIIARETGNGRLSVDVVAADSHGI